MNTLNKLISSTIERMNNEIIEDLVVDLGYDFNTATKLVEEFVDFDFIGADDQSF